jgi:hypothetical protein
MAGLMCGLEIAGLVVAVVPIFVVDVEGILRPILIFVLDLTATKVTLPRAKAVRLQEDVQLMVVKSYDVTSHSTR